MLLADVTAEQLGTLVMGVVLLASLAVNVKQLFFGKKGDAGDDPHHAEIHRSIDERLEAIRKRVHGVANVTNHHAVKMAELHLIFRKEMEVAIQPLTEKVTRLLTIVEERGRREE